MNKEKIKNKRLISWAYIWRFLISIVISVIIGVVILKVISIFMPDSDIDNLYMVENYTLGDLITNSVKLNIISKIIGAIIFSLTILLGWKIIHKVVSNKVTIEKQNEKYVLKSVGIVTGVIMFGILCIFLYSPIEETVDGNYLNISETRDTLYETINTAKDFIDLCNQDLFKNSEKLLMSVKMYDFDIEPVINTLSIAMIITWTIIIIILIEVICQIILNHRKIKKLIVDNTLDENNNIVSTQGKLRKKYKIIFLIVHICIVLIVVYLIAENYYEEHKYDWLFNNEIYYNQHIPIEESNLYHEYTISSENLDEEDEIKSIESGDNVDYYDEEDKKWLKLEHDDEWYLNNPINAGEAVKYIYLHPNYNIDEEYVYSMYDSVNKFLKDIEQYLDNTDSKNLYSLEEEFDIKFIHTGENQYMYILDNKNLLTGVGIIAYVDNFTDRNIKSMHMWDSEGIFYKIKENNDIKNLKITINNIEDKLSLIYEDMTPEEVIPILGNSYLYYNNISNRRDYTWYDKMHNYIKFIYVENQIKYISFYKNTEE